MTRILEIRTESEARCDLESDMREETVMDFLRDLDEVSFLLCNQFPHFLNSYCCSGASFHSSLPFPRRNFRCFYWRRVNRIVSTPTTSCQLDSFPQTRYVFVESSFCNPIRSNSTANSPNNRGLQVPMSIWSRNAQFRLWFERVFKMPPSA